MKKNTILYAEDREDVSSVVMPFFRNIFPDYKIEHFENGSLLEKKLEEGNLLDVGVIVMDHQMPEKDGLEVIKDNIHNVNGIPIILFYSGGKDIGEKAIQYGAKGYFIKPNPFPLIDEMKKYLE